LLILALDQISTVLNSVFHFCHATKIFLGYGSAFRTAINLPYVMLPRHCVHRRKKDFGAHKKQGLLWPYGYGMERGNGRSGNSCLHHMPPVMITGFVVGLEERDWELEEVELGS